MKKRYHAMMEYKHRAGMNAEETPKDSEARDFIKWNHKAKYGMQQIDLDINTTSRVGEDPSDLQKAHIIASQRIHDTNMGIVQASTAKVFALATTSSEGSEEPDEKEKERKSEKKRNKKRTHECNQSSTEEVESDALEKVRIANAATNTVRCGIKTYPLCGTYHCIQNCQQLNGVCRTLARRKTIGMVGIHAAECKDSSTRGHEVL
jgi:hypothetical protein